MSSKIDCARKRKELKKSIVDHTYRDYSTVVAKDLTDCRARDALFPSKLHSILSTEEYAHIITWKPHGRAWVVLDKSKLVSVILPDYFDTRKPESFNRSVNDCGFKVCAFDLYCHTAIPFFP